jgi:transcriptional regulator with XRE-family HTH domain
VRPGNALSDFKPARPSEAGPVPAAVVPVRHALTRRESVGTALARNLVVARLAQGVTQNRLSAEAGVSRATIAQLETGVCDPRVSTVAELARALGLPPALLLLSGDEIRALVRLADEVRGSPAPVRPEEAARMRALLRTGLLRDRNRVARTAADAVRCTGDGTPPPPAVLALSAIFSTVEPGAGTTVGAALGRVAGI